MENKVNLLKKKQQARVGNITKYVFDDPTPALLISLMQLTAAFTCECINILILSGQRTVSKCFSLYVALKVVSLVDNMYLGAIQDPTMEKM